MDQNNRKLKLSKRWIIFLYLYYFIIFLTGFLASVFAICPRLLGSKQFDIFETALIGAIGMALNGSSIFYTRKLYKSTISGRLLVSEERADFIERLGKGTYFFARPLFAMGFAVLIVVGLQSGFIVSLTDKTTLDEGFVYLVMFLSFFVGFLSGRFIKYLEKKGSSFVGTIVQMKEGESDN